MNPSPHTPSETAPIPVPAAPVRVLVPVPPEPEALFFGLTHAPPPVIYRSGGEIILEYGAEPPTDLCVRCGRPSSFAKRFPLRHSRDFRTWFGARSDMGLGLCRRHGEDHSVAVALTWSTLAVGAMLVIVGMLTLGWFSIFLGLVVMGISGIFRASSPVSAQELTENRRVIVGAGDYYLRHLPIEPKADGEAKSGHAMVP